MPLSMSEKIKVILKRRNMTLGEDLRTIAAALDCTYAASLTMNDTGEVI